MWAEACDRRRVDSIREIPARSPTSSSVAALGRLCRATRPAPAHRRKAPRSSSRPSAPRCCHCDLCHTFRKIVDATGVGILARRRPRIHDIRHTFAVRNAVRVVPGRPRCAGPACRACPLSSGTRTRYPPTGTSRPRRSCSAGCPRLDPPRAPGHERTRPDPAGCSSPNGWPGSARPAHVPSCPTATPTGCYFASCRTAPAKRPQHWDGKMSTPR